MEEYDYIALDLGGYRYNSKYPPNYELYGDDCHGYKNYAREVLFYYFAVQYYDVHFVYNGKDYYLLMDNDHVATCDSHYTEEYERFDDAIQLIENLEIEGRKLIDLLDEFDDDDIEHV